MLLAARCFPDWKLVEPQENLSRSRTAAFKRQILLLSKSTVLAAPHREAPSLRNVSSCCCGSWLDSPALSPKHDHLQLSAGRFGTHLGDAARDSLLMDPHPEQHTFACWVTSNLPHWPPFLASFQQRGIRADDLSSLGLLPDQIQPSA